MAIYTIIYTYLINIKLSLQITIIGDISKTELSHGKIFWPERDIKTRSVSRLKSRKLGIGKRV